MKEPILDGQCFTPPEPSACVKRARRSGMCLRLKPSPDPPLRAITFATRTGSSTEKWYALKDSLSKRAAGELAACKQTWDKKDPVQSYLFVGLRSGMILEAVGLHSEPRTLELYVQGAAFARLMEIEVPQPKSWWRRIFFGERRWHVVLQDQVVGQIGFSYPVTNSTRLSFQLREGESLPISAGFVWWRRESNFVIPPDTPELHEPYLEKLHFLLAIVFRVMICDVDLSGG